MLYECPQCGGKEFIVPSTYLVYTVRDERGDYLRDTGERTCLERWSNWDEWRCKDCGYEADESNFILSTD